MQQEQLRDICERTIRMAPSPLPYRIAECKLYSIPYCLGDKSTLPVLRQLPEIGERYGDWSIDESYSGGAPEEFDVIKTVTAIDSIESCGTIIDVYIIVYVHYDVDREFVDLDYKFVGRPRNPSISSLL